MQRDARWVGLIVVDADVRLHEVLFIGLGDVDELLGIQVVQREPSALDLHHHAMAFLEAVGNVWQGKAHLRDLARLECLWEFEAVAIATTHHLTTYQHLVAAHQGGEGLTVIETLGVALRIAEVFRELIDDLHYKVGISGADRHQKIGNDFTCEGEVFRHRLAIEREHIGATGGETLIVRHVFTCSSTTDLIGIWHRVIRV